MKLKDLFTRYKYLIRMTCAIILALCIPIAFMGYMVIRSSYREMRESAQGYYMDSVRAAAQGFREQTASMTALALQIGIEHKLSRRTIESHAWNIVEASQLLAAYNSGLRASSDLGLLFAGSDYIITTQYKYSLPAFSKKFAGDDADLAAKLEGFLRAPYTAGSYCSTFEQGGDSLFFRVPIHLSSSTQKDAAILFFLDEETLNQGMAGAFAFGSCVLSVFDGTGTPLFSVGEGIGLPGEDAFSSFLAQPAPGVYEDASGDRFVYKLPDSAQGMTFALTVKRELAEKNLFSFYTALQTILLLTGVLIPLVLIPAIHLNYRPVLSLLRKVQRSGEAAPAACGELQLIGEAFDKVSLEKNTVLQRADEQRLALTDYAFHKLLEGGGLTQREEALLNIPRGGVFCAAAAQGLRLDHQRRVRIAEGFYRRCRGTLYLLDVPNERHTAVLCMLPAAIERETLCRELAELFAPDGGVNIGVGHLTARVPDIRASYICALNRLEPERELAPGERPGGLADFAYPCEEAGAFAQYVQCADSAKAAESLRQAVDSIERLGGTFLYKRFLCGILLTDYLKTLHRLGIPCGADTVARIANFATLEEFCGLLGQSARQACEEAVQRKRRANESFNRSVVDYIDAHYCSEDTSLVQVADQFGISIYTLSRVFKEQTGARFKEYITRRRLEYGRELLLTTDDSIKRIAQKVGLRDADYFAKLFKERYQVPPSKLRGCGPP